MTKKIEPTDWREGRRLGAWELKQQGWSQKDIAAALGVSQGAVSQWMKRGVEGGEAGLRRKVPPGLTPRLSQAQREQLPGLLRRGAAAYGFRGDVWTGSRVAAVIEREFGVTYHEGHVRRLLKTLNWSHQKPVERASGRDEAAIARWQVEDWAALKKSPSGRLDDCLCRCERLLFAACPGQDLGTSWTNAPVDRAAVPGASVDDWWDYLGRQAVDLGARPGSHRAGLCLLPTSSAAAYSWQSPRRLGWLTGSP